MKSLQKDFQKNLKDFANKRQVKHTSTVLEPSIPFHTLVKLVDAEDIANDKIRTHDLALEINNITKQFNTQTLFVFVIFVRFSFVFCSLAASSRNVTTFSQPVQNHILIHFANL